MSTKKEQSVRLIEMLRKKPIRRLCLIGLLVFLVLAFVVFASVYLTTVLRQANLMEHHLSSLPQVYDERVEELNVRVDAYEKDYQIRSDLGAKLYEFEDESDRTIERLDAVRETISASCAAALTAKALSEYGNSLEPESRTIMGVFFYGYGIFMCLFAFFAGIAANRGHWPAFAYVFDWKWSRGVHLFSIWAAILILAGGFFVTALLHRLLGTLDHYADHRTKTVVRLVDSLVSYTAILFLLAWTLYLFGVDTKALIASAGMVSIAVGMGARELVTDILAGVFMLLEGSLHVGDTVQVGGWEGVVTDMGIRTTRITNADGEVKILNNSHISDVVNKNCEQS